MVGAVEAGGFAVEAVEEVEVEIKAKHLWIAIQTAIFQTVITL